VQFYRVPRWQTRPRATGRVGDPATRVSVAQLHIELQALRYTGYRALATLQVDGGMTV